MYKGLYDKFANWFRGGNIWLYSDPHFGDEEMKYIRKNYIGDDEQVKRINTKVGKYDTIIFLGDIGNVDYIRKIRGFKVLFMGNHDVGASKYKGEGLFDEVYEGPEFINSKIVLSHEPFDSYAFNIHGHKHDLEYKYDDKHLNVCAEAINYSPVSLLTLLKTGVASKIVDIHRVTIDNATARKRNKGA